MERCMKIVHLRNNPKERVAIADVVGKETDVIHITHLLVHCPGARWLDMSIRFFYLEKHDAMHQ